MFGMLGGLGLLLAGTSPANATIDWNLVSFSGDSYTYSITFTPNVNEALDGGGLATLYDFVGLTSAAQVSYNATAAANFNAPTVQALGINGFSQAPPDSPTINNVTLTYKGAPITAVTNLGQVTITGGLAANLVSPIIGFYSGQSTDTSVTPNGPSGNTGRVQVPSAVPAPASVVMLGLGMGVMGIARLRKRLLRA